MHARSMQRRGVIGVCIFYKYVSVFLTIFQMVVIIDEEVD